MDLTGLAPTYVKSYGMWQFTSSGAVVGIKGNVDMNAAFLNYPEIIKGAHLNGF